MVEQIQETTILSRNLPPRLPGNKIALRYRIETADTGESSNWSTVYYVNGPTIVNTSIDSSIVSSLVKTDAETFTIQWTDPNPIDEYDVFAAFSIDCEEFTLTRRSVNFDKYLYSTDPLVAEEFNMLYVGAKIDAVDISNALNGEELTVTEINSTTSPYYIKFTGDSSNSIANTATTVGYIILSKTSNTNPRTSTTLQPYQYIATVPGSSLAKRFSFQTRNIGTAGKQSQRAQVFVQAACSNKTADTSLFILESARASLI